MFVLIKYGVGCTQSIKQMLLDWSRKLVPRRGVAGSRLLRFILFIIMFLHGRACTLVLAGQPDACRRDVMARAGFESKFRSFSLVLLAGCRARSLIPFR